MEGLTALEKPTFGNFHSNNSVKQHQWILRTSGGNFDEEQDIKIVSKYLPTKYSLSANRNGVTLQWKSLA